MLRAISISVLTVIFRASLQKHSSPRIWTKLVSKGRPKPPTDLNLPGHWRGETSSIHVTHLRTCDLVGELCHRCALEISSRCFGFLQSLGQGTSLELLGGLSFIFLKVEGLRLSPSHLGPSVSFYKTDHERTFQHLPLAKVFHNSICYWCHRALPPLTFNPPILVGHWTGFAYLRCHNAPQQPMHEQFGIQVSITLAF